MRGATEIEKLFKNLKLTFTLYMETSPEQQHNYDVTTEAIEWNRRTGILFKTSSLFCLF